MNDRDTYTYTPSHLVRFIESPFASWMDRYALEYPLLAPEKDPPDPLLETLQRKGSTHELNIEMSRKEEGKSVVKIDRSSQASAATLSAMKEGVDCIFQARIEMPRFIGFSDCLVKTFGKSNLGNHYYELEEIKLSNIPKPHHIIQLCCYAEMLEYIQGVRPKNITIILGSGEKSVVRTNDCFQYYLWIKKAFLEEQNNFDPNKMPDPGACNSWGNWSNYAEYLLKKNDHLCRVAHIKKSQIKKLHKSDIHTMQQLAETNIDRVPGIHTSVFLKLKKQAYLQKASEEQKKPLYEVLIPKEGEKQGLALLPSASSLDVFFDIEGFPLEKDGLEYLWGCSYFNQAGERTFKDFWAHNREEEKLAFQGFIKWVYARWQLDPAMHIYHYANYEIAACRKLMGRFGMCEEEMDQLLRNEVFIDLYHIVKEGLIVGETCYSIKKIENLYRGKRSTDVGNGGDSVVAYETWREGYARGEEKKEWRNSPLLQSIRDYNIDDCDSTQELTEWLRDKQKKHAIPYLGKVTIAHPVSTETITERTLLRDRLLEQADKLSDPLSKKKKLLENLAWFLEFHRREARPVFWRLFDRLSLSHEELLDDPECLAFCQRTDRPPFKTNPNMRNQAYEYRFDAHQEFKGTTKCFYILGEEDHEKEQNKVFYLPEESSLEEGKIVLQSKKEPKPLISLIPDEYVHPNPIPEAIYELILAYEQGKLQRCAIIDFLNRSIPCIHGHLGGQIIKSNLPEQKLEQIAHAIENLDHSYLPIQGPPGSGKSYTAKYIMARLLKKGCKIGISSNSHKAINHLLLNTAQYAQEQGIPAHFVCTKNTEKYLPPQGICFARNSELSGHVRSSCVLGATAWGFARQDMVHKLDYLFIDEAGQVSVANLLAMSRSAKNLVLIGDQMQLGQPRQGSHPAESGLSILEYLLHHSPTISEEMGVFLGTTRRMHPDVNHFISENMYEGKLQSHPSNKKRVIKVPENYRGKLSKESGIIFIPVHHEGNTQASKEEINEIKHLTKELLKRTLISSEGKESPLTWNDILFVTPYNYQCRMLQSELGPQAKVGSVDKFQGQEASVVFLSMCTSDVSECPRGLDFLLNKNRMNVAISRAQTLAIVVANPNVTKMSVNSISQLKQMNLFNKLCMFLPQSINSVRNYLNEHSRAN